MGSYSMFNKLLWYYNDHGLLIKINHTASLTGFLDRRKGIGWIRFEFDHIWTHSVKTDIFFGNVSSMFERLCVCVRVEWERTVEKVSWMRTKYGPNEWSITTNMTALSICRFIHSKKRRKIGEKANKFLWTIQTRGFFPSWRSILFSSPPVFPLFPPYRFNIFVM